MRGNREWDGFVEDGCTEIRVVDRGVMMQADGLWSPEIQQLITNHNWAQGSGRMNVGDVQSPWQSRSKLSLANIQLSTQVTDYQLKV